MHDLNYFAQQFVNGALAGGLYVLIAIGITIVFGLTGTVNFAQGQFLMIGAYLAYAMYAGAAGYLPIVLAVTILIGITGIGAERTLFRWTRANPVNGFIISLGLITILQATAVGIWGLDTKTIPTPFNGAIAIGGVRIAWQRLLVLAIALALVGILFWFLRRTKTGRALRAAAEDREMASVLGVNVTMMTILAFFIGTGLAGSAGALFISIAGVTPFVGSQYIFKGFAIAIIGGLGSVTGAAIVGFALGIAEALMTSYVDSAWREAYIFGLMVLVILVRPQGLFRGTEGGRID